MATPNPLEFLAKLIPGYAGHQQLEKRREDDTLTRNYIAKRLDESKRALDRHLKAMMETNPLEGIAEGDKIRRSITHVQDRLKSAVEGYSSWFDKRVVDDAVLKKVAEADADAVGLVDRLVTAVGVGRVPDWPVIENLLTTLGQRIDKRHAILRGDGV